MASWHTRVGRVVWPVGGFGQLAEWFGRLAVLASWRAMASWQSGLASWRAMASWQSGLAGWRFWPVGKVVGQLAGDGQLAEWFGRLAVLASWQSGLARAELTASWVTGLWVLVSEKGKLTVDQVEMYTWVLMVIIYIYLLGTDTHIWKYIIDCSLCLLLLPMAILPLFLRRGGDGQLAEWFSQLAVLTSWQVMASWRTRFGQLAGDGPPAQPGGQSPSPPSPNRPSRHYHGPSSGVQAAESLGGGVAGPFQFHVENFTKAVPTGFFV
jgi:hypothetical protein